MLHSWCDVHVLPDCDTMPAVILFTADDLLIN